VTRRVRLAITLGDPRGIGPEVVAAALAAGTTAEITVIGAREQVGSFGADHVVPTGSWRPAEATGRATAVEAGLIAGRAVQQAARLALSGEVDGIVTAPVEKHALHLAGFQFPGHTEWLAHLAGDCPVAMMLASDRLRVVLVTTHVAFRDVPLLLTADKIVRTGEVTRAGLQRWFGIAEPRLALCALNPHAGEQGLFGDEEARVLAPAAERLGAAGPLPADTVFVRAMRGEFDAVLAPYHDVGMTAIKVASFGSSVNVTLGLPFVRTSPDHGTAMDIAGLGRADASSMIAALHLAIDLVERSRPQ
jgi:4-hydroxythreonine-4-phosphate dehydrogenase